MPKTQKYLTIALWATVVLAVGAVVALQMRTRNSSATAPNATIVGTDAQPVQVNRTALPNEKFEPLFDAATFRLIDQNGKSLANTDLRGNVWIADFVFTHCAGPCPVMTGKMADLQKQVKRSNVKLISFSVDPERDTPPVLKEYATRFGADDQRWHFLTGHKAEIFDIAAAMRIAAKPAQGEEPILHSTKFLLVDKGGSVVGVYDSKSEEELKQLATDATALADRK